MPGRQLLLISADSTRNEMKSIIKRFHKGDSTIDLKMEQSKLRFS